VQTVSTILALAEQHNSMQHNHPEKMLPAAALEDIEDIAPGTAGTNVAAEKAASAAA
jgi:hypothetical protein